MAGKGKRMKCLRPTSGFTLVEALVAGVIATILATIIFTVFSMYNGESRESAIYSKLQRQYENVSEQIAFDTRRASRVLKTAGEFTNPFIPTAVETVKTIVMCDTSGSQFSGFSVNTDTLQEWKNGGWRKYQAGGGMVGLNAIGSVFILNTSRDRVDLRLRLQLTDRDSTYYHGARKDAYACRNQRLP